MSELGMDYTLYTANEFAEVMPPKSEAEECREIKAWVEEQSAILAAKQQETVKELKRIAE